MKRFLSLLAGLCFTAVLMAADVLPITLTKADGLPGRFTGDSNEFTTRLFEFDEPVSSIRFTVITTNTTDTLTSYSYDGLSAGYGPGFPFFTMSEFRIADADGNWLKLTEDMLSSNAVATNDGGGLAALVDNNTGTHFHGTYSRGELPQAYHYIEVSLPEPMSAFKLRWFSRSNRKNMPTTVGITAGGVEYMPYPEYGFELGRQVTTLEEIAEGGVFVLKGNYFTYEYPDEEGVYGRTAPYRGDAFYHSPYGAALTPSAADLITFVPTGEKDTYYIHWLVNDHYVYNPVGKIETSNYAEWVNNSFDAGKFTFTECDTVPGSFIIKADNIYLGQRRFVRMSVVNDTCKEENLYTYHYAWNVYKANINNIKGTAIENELKRVIGVADSLITLQGYIESQDEGEFEELKAAVATGRELLNTENVAADIAVRKTNEIDLLTAQYRKQYLFVLVDTITYILEESDVNFNDGSNGWNIGDYPEQCRQPLSLLIDDANVRAEEVTALVDISLMIADLEEGLKNFYASRVEKVYRLPLRFTEDDGLPGERENGNSNGSYLWDTPLIYLNDPIDVIRITVTKATKQDNYSSSGTVMFCLGEFELYNAAGELIPLREDMFEVNSLCSTDGSGIAALVDGDHGTWFHTAYADEHDITPSSGEYSYVQVNLDEEITAFRYRMVSRANNSYNRAPTDFGITTGETYDPDDVPVQDPYNLQIIEQVTDVSQITDGGHYILYGNFNKFDIDGEEVVGEGSGYYTGTNLYDSKYPHSCCLFTFENAGDGKFYLHSLSNNYYVQKPITWEGVSSTYFKKDAAPFTIQEHDSHEDMFYIYYTGIVNDEFNELNGTEAVFPLQDWGGEMGSCPLVSLNDQFELDGQSEWSIYKVSVDNFGLMWLQSVLASVDASGFTAEAFGENPGQYNGAGVAEFKNSLIAAQALADTKDAAAAKAAADKLQANIEALSTLEVNPIVIGGEYYIVSTYNAFYDIQQKEMAIFSDLNDEADLEVTSTHQPYWGTLLDENNGTKDEFTWIIEQGDTTTIETTPGDIYTYIKNKETGEYIGTWKTWSARLPMSETPVLYFFRNAGGVKYNIGSPDAQKNFEDYNDTHFALHILGHDDGKADWGHICLWHYNVDQSRWKLVNAGTTSINSIIDEAEGEIVSTTYYSTDGKISATPVKGVNIVKTIHANGAIKIKKIIVK